MREDVVGPPGGPPAWYRDIWPWLLAVGLVVLALVGGVIAYQAFSDDDGDESATVATVTTEPTETGTTIEGATTTAEEPPELVETPNLVGLNQVDAGSSVEGLGLVGDSYPVASDEQRGTVVAQRPNPGMQLEEGETVRMNVALGEGAREPREVPDVTGPEASNARDSLRRAGFTVRTLYRQPPSPEEEGEVLTQEPAPETSAPELSQVTIYVGRQ